MPARRPLGSLDTGTRELELPQWLLSDIIQMVHENDLENGSTSPLPHRIRSVKRKSKKSKKSTKGKKSSRPKALRVIMMR